MTSTSNRSTAPGGNGSVRRRRCGAGLLSAVAIVGVLPIFTDIAPASTISANGEILNQTTIGTGTDLALSGYSLANDAPTAHEPSWVSGVVYDGNQGTSESANYASLVANGTTYSTAIAWATLSSSTYTTLAQFTLASTGIPSEFQLGFLADNSNTVNNPAYFLVEETNGAGTVIESNEVQTVADTDTGTNYQDDFYLVTVSGAAAGDVIDIYGESRSSGSRTSIGGITFDTVPEPVSATLLVAPALLAMMGRRHRRQT